MADTWTVCVRCRQSFERVHDDLPPDEMPNLVLCDDCIQSFKRWWYAAARRREKTDD